MSAGRKRQHAHEILACLTLLGAVFTAITSQRAAAATPSEGVAKRLRVHLDTDFLGWTRGRSTTGSIYPGVLKPASYKVDHVGFGFARPLAGDAVLGDYGLASADLILGASNSMFGLGVGYGVSRRVVIGARVGASFDHSSSPSMETDGTKSSNFFGAIFAPYIEILVRRRGRILPFVSARAGFGAATVAQRFSSGAFEGALRSLHRTSVIAPAVGLGFGAHFFIGKHVSLDASVAFDYRWFFARGRTADNSEAASVITPWKNGWQSFTLGMVLGISAWIF